MRRLLGLMLWLGLLAAARGDEAVLPDGKRLAGTLALDREGRLRFHPAGDTAPLSLSAVRHVRFEPSITPLRVPAWHHVRLADGQEVTGQLLGLDARQLALRTAWAERLAIPRAAVVTLGHPPGRITMIQDDFAGGLGNWKSTGKPALGGPATSGKQAVLLAPGQTIERSFDPPIGEGRLGVNFRPVEAPRSAVWEAHLEFVEGKKARRLTITLAGPDLKEHTASGLEGHAEKVTRADDWRRLEVQWGANALRVTIDGAVLWYRLESGAGSLRRLRLEGQGLGGAEAGRLAFDDFGMERALANRRRPPGDPEQDEVWLTLGDQLFGSVRSADSHRLTLEGAFGSREFSWTEVRSVWPKQASPAPQVVPGERLRLELDNTTQALPDRLEGVLTGLDARTLRLRHARLGELTLPRAALRRIETVPGR